MKEIYWLTVLGNVSDVCTIINVSVLICIIAVTILSPFLIEGYSDLCYTAQELLKKCCKVALCLGAACLIAAVFVPSKKDLMAIYGIGGTIDYIKSNEKAKELPDKVVEALYKYLDAAKDKEE